MAIMEIDIIIPFFKTGFLGISSIGVFVLLLIFLEEGFGFLTSCFAPFFVANIEELCKAL